MMMTTAVAVIVTATAVAVVVVAAGAVAAAATMTTTMMTRMTTAMATTITSLAMIESTGAAVVLLPHGPNRRGLVVAQPSSDVRECVPKQATSNSTDARRADVRAFVLGRGWRDDSTVGVIVVGGNGGA